MLLRIESKDCCILLAHVVPLTNGRTQMGFVYSSGRKSQFQLCLRFFICLIWFICHLSSLQRHFIMVSWCQFICQQTRLLFLIVHIPGTVYETAGCRSHSGDLNQQKKFFYYCWCPDLRLSFTHLALIYQFYVTAWYWSVKVEFHYLEREWGSLVEHIVIACLSFSTGCDYMVASWS
jgi:hypothetical protein